MDIANHPCFNAEARHKTGRIHLAVAPKCNVQCNFCNRKFDCANESRPGVSTSLLKPAGALEYLTEIDRKVPNLAVVGIAGPGDPFANANETMETLELVHARFPEKLLCVSSNGLAIYEYIPRLAELNVSHVTITVNAVDPVVGADVYEWVYYNKKSYNGIEGATILLERQTEAIKLLKQLGITVKINTVVIPRVNEHHVHEISKYTAALGADIQNCIPLIPVAGTPYEQLTEPSASAMRMVRAKTSLHIKQMTHCARCRADAVGLLGQDVNQALAAEREGQSQKLSIQPNRPYVAIATSDGATVNQHLGHASELWIYGLQNGKVELIEKRSIAAQQESDDRWNNIADAINDCSVLLVNKLGESPLRTLRGRGLFVEAVSGRIDGMVDAIFSGKPIPKDFLRLAGHCDSGGCAESECA